LILFDSIFGRKKRDFSKEPPCIPDQTRIYAIGDIHGRADLLEALHENILNDAKIASGGMKMVVVYLGDYMDRGAQSRQVLDMLIASPLVDFKPVYLKGNHEDALLTFLENDSIGPDWFSIGGDACLYSYQISPQNGLPAKKKFKQLQEGLKSAIPDDHLAFLSNLKLIYGVGDYIFVHAGIMPGRPLSKQNPAHLMWVRDEFLNDERNYGKIIVHGHTITAKPDIRANRIGIDTGAYATGILTCLVLEGTQRRFLTTEAVGLSSSTQSHYSQDAS